MCFWLPLEVVKSGHTQNPVYLPVFSNVPFESDEQKRKLIPGVNRI